SPSPQPRKVPTSRIVVLDPGHGGKETGAVSAGGLAEKKVNLQIALKLRTLLEGAGYKVVMTRSGDSAVNTGGRDLNGNGVVDNDDDLQARVDLANKAHADIFISIHNNGDTDPAAEGTTIYYCDARPFVAESIRLASALRRHLVEDMDAAGYSTQDKGIADDSPLGKPFGHLFVLGPLTPRVARASSMPGALGETLYLSNRREAALLGSDKMLASIAQGYFEGIEEYFGR
ncbi:MAG TPA: N-acetylmuramoyl-L-alanine amidase, partial [Chloroflexia bacterium]|nr:N-acetylmuramoyl-L-alanine amidase [Chloroflexia bacterium]